MKFKMVGTVNRNIQEDYSVIIEAADKDEALDVVYAILSEYPESEMIAARLVCTRRENLEEPKVVAVQVEGDTANDEESPDEYA